MAIAFSIPVSRTGETIAQCAEREVLEETGLEILNTPDASAEGFSSDLAFPTAFAACDAIFKDRSGRVQFHYGIIEVRHQAAVVQFVDVCIHEYVCLLEQ